MLKRFTLWLVSLYLTNKDLLELAVKGVFLKNPAYTVDQMVRLAQLNSDRPKGFPESTNMFFASTVLREVGLEGSIYILSLLKIKEHVCYCSPDCSEESLHKFFTRVVEIKDASNNPLKVRKELTDYVSSVMVLACPSDITAIVNTLHSQAVSVEATVRFLTTGAK